MLIKLIQHCWNKFNNVVDIALVIEPHYKNKIEIKLKKMKKKLNVTISTLAPSDDRIEDINTYTYMFN